MCVGEVGGEEERSPEAEAVADVVAVAVDHVGHGEDICRTVPWRHRVFFKQIFPSSRFIRFTRNIHLISVNMCYCIYYSNIYHKIMHKIILTKNRHFTADILIIVQFVR